MKGKNFSGNNLGQRKKSDFYETPYSITWQLFQAEHFQKDRTVLEPACGNLAIVKILDKFGFDAIKYYDINNKKHKGDFLEDTQTVDYIITNPPYAQAFQFVQHAKEVALLKFAMLLPLSYLHGKKRYDTIYSDRNYPLARVHVFTRYPMLGEELRRDGKYKTGMMVYAWFVFESRDTWEHNKVGSPIITWLDNDKYVIRSSQEKKDGNKGN